MRAMLVLVFCTALSACADRHYSKPDATTEDGARAVAACQAAAPPIDQPFLDHCMRAKGWIRTD